MIGAWDRWSAARTFPVPKLWLSDLEFCADGRTLVLCATGCVIRLDTRTGRTTEARFGTTCRWFSVDPASGRVLHGDRAGLRVIALRKTSAHAPPRLLLTPDGRHLVLPRIDGFDAFEALVVDLAVGRARPLERIEHNHGRTDILCLGIDEDATRLTGATLTEYTRRIEFWRRPLAGGKREPAGDSKSVGGHPVAISSDGRWLWWEDYDAGELTLTAAAAGVAADPVEQWDLDGKISACCAGRSLLAIAAAGDLLVMATDGRCLDTGLPRDCVPLAFAPDERALWIRDETGLLLELSLDEWPDDDDDSVDT